MKKLVMLALVALSLALTGCANQSARSANAGKVEQIQQRTDQPNRAMRDSQMMGGGSLRGVPLGGAMPPH